jgi:hypothetical protein
MAGMMGLPPCHAYMAQNSQVMTAFQQLGGIAPGMVLPFPSWLVVRIHRQSCLSSRSLDPLNVTPHTHLVRILCVASAKCDTRLASVVSFPPRAMRMRRIPIANQNVNDSIPLVQLINCQVQERPPLPRVAVSAEPRLHCQQLCEKWHARPRATMPVGSETLLNTTPVHRIYAIALYAHASCWALR